MNKIFTLLFELFYSSQIKDDINFYNLNGSCGIIMLTTALLFSLIFYFGFDKSKYNKLWPAFLLINFFVVMLITIYLCRGTLEEENLIYPFADYLYFSLIVAFFSSFIFFILSFVFKPFSNNLIYSPFKFPLK